MTATERKKRTMTRRLTRRLRSALGAACPGLYPIPGKAEQADPRHAGRVWYNGRQRSPPEPKKEGIMRHRVTTVVALLTAAGFLFSALPAATAAEIAAAPTGVTV